MQLLAERFSRSLLSFLAPLDGVVGVALTNRLTNWLALPLSCLALMSVNLLCEWVIISTAAGQAWQARSCRSLPCMPARLLPFLP
jgi:hypothetical protein